MTTRTAEQQALDFLRLYGWNLVSNQEPYKFHKADPRAGEDGITVSISDFPIQAQWMPPQRIYDTLEMLAKAVL